MKEYVNIWYNMDNGNTIDYEENLDAGNKT
jgi:hypothetical protein